MKRTATALAMLAVAASGQVAHSMPAPPPADDVKPERRRRPLAEMWGGTWGIPYPHLHHVSRETMQGKPGSTKPEVRAERRARRRRRMKLRKLRGWR